MGHDQDLHQTQTLGELSEIKSICSNSSSRNLLWKKAMKRRSRNSTRNKTLRMIKRRRARRASQEGSRRSTMIEKKVRTLKKLIPNGDSSEGLDGLFRDTAEYISNLKMRVSIMQAVVNALSKSE